MLLTVGHMELWQQYKLIAGDCNVSHISLSLLYKGEQILWSGRVTRWSFLDVLHVLPIVTLWIFKL